jgi:hypothetical protein
MRRAICVVLSFCLAGIGLPQAMAQGTSMGSGGSITIDTVDPERGRHVDAGLIQNNQRVRVVVKAFDPYGREIDCGTPTIGVKNGVAGTQLIGPEAGGPPDIIRGGPTFGSAEITATCPNLPDVQAKSFAASKGRPLGGGSATAQAPSSGGSLLLAGLAIAGGVARAAAAAGGGGDSSSSSSYCLRWDCRNAGGSQAACTATYGGNVTGNIGYSSLGACQAAKPNDNVSSCSAC